MKMKKIFSALCAASVLLSSAGVSVLLMSSNAIAEETDLVGTEEEKGLIVPQNVRIEDGFLVWDEDENAYGYTVQGGIKGSEYVRAYYESRVELNRFFYDYNFDFGEYEFEVCAFDESGNSTDFSAPVSVSYAPNFETPANVKLSEDGESVSWDEVDRAARYNWRIYKNDEEHTLYTYSWQSYNNLPYKAYLSESGNYLISIQAMDRDYNVSEWTEPIEVTYSANSLLGTPENIRLDESGENLLWDAVDGADYYYVTCYSMYADRDWCEEGLSTSAYAEQTQFENWKSLTWPFANGEYQFQVCAYSNSGSYSEYSASLDVSFKYVHDESIDVPKVTAGDSFFDLTGVSGAEQYFLCVSVNGKLLSGEMYSLSRDTASVYVGKRLPACTYDLEMFVVDGNGKYNSETYSVSLNTVPDETVWIPNMYYKFETLLWDWDYLRHEDTSLFWIRLMKDNEVVQLVKSWSEYYYGLSELSNGEYDVQVCVYENTDKIGKWSDPLHIAKHDGGLFDKENETTTEVEIPPEAADVPEEDRITSITINPAFNMKHKDGDDVELDLSKIKIKAKEIYDEEGLKRASEALGETISGNKHYNLLDLTLLYNEEDFSNGYDGLVQVIIPIPAGHRDKTFSCYRLTEVNGKMVKELIPGEQTEDSYIIYLEHFSEYALVGDGGESDHTHAYGDDWKSDKNSHWKECECGSKTDNAAHTFGEWKVTKEATESSEGSKERVCDICGYKQTETLPKLTTSTPDEPTDDPIEPLPDEPSAPSAPDEPSAPSAPEVSDSAPAASDTTSSEPTSSDTMSGEPANSDNTTSSTPSSSNGNPATGVAAVSVLPIAAVAGAVAIIIKKKK